MYATFGMPSAAQVATTAGIAPSRHGRMSPSSVVFTRCSRRGGVPALGPGVWSKADFRLEADGDQVIELVGEHGAGHVRPEAHLLDLVLHRREVTRQHRLVRGFGVA